MGNWQWCCGEAVRTPKSLRCRPGVIYFLVSRGECNEGAGAGRRLHPSLRLQGHLAPTSAAASFSSLFSLCLYPISSSCPLCCLTVVSPENDIKFLFASTIRSLDTLTMIYYNLHFTSSPDTVFAPVHFNCSIQVPLYYKDYPMVCTW